ncbi:MAG TPA: sigma-70 family RNA polymerase sigma factor [Candidatus Paceibacterota bacterium]|nr:sigma-70 family RNA polymerase sigma factor [Candidatus Paceibacterota bacterium]
MGKTSDLTISGNSISIKNYFKDLRKIEQLSSEEQNELAIKAKAGDQKAMEKLVECNLRFVLTIAKDYQYGNVDVKDLINEGNIGLIKAVEKFDPSRGFKFISYAVWWVRQSIMQFIYEHGNMVRLPINKINVIGKVNKAVEQLHHKLDREPTVEEIQAITDFSVEDIKSSYMDNARCFSIDQKISEDSDTEMIDIIPGETMEDIEGKLNGESLKHEINNVLTTLTERETQILNMYFGLNGSKELGLKEIGDSLGLTNERVRQIKELALKKLRMYGKSSKLREFLNCKIS